MKKKMVLSHCALRRSMSLCHTRIHTDNNQLFTFRLQTICADIDCRCDKMSYTQIEDKKKKIRGRLGRTCNIFDSLISHRKKLTHRHNNENSPNKDKTKRKKKTHTNYERSYWFCVSPSRLQLREYKYERFCFQIFISFKLFTVFASIEDSSIIIFETNKKRNTYEQNYFKFTVCVCLLCKSSKCRVCRSFVCHLVWSRLFRALNTLWNWSNIIISDIKSSTYLSVQLSEAGKHRPRHIALSFRVKIAYFRFQFCFFFFSFHFSVLLFFPSQQYT